MQERDWLALDNGIAYLRLWQGLLTIPAVAELIDRNREQKRAAAAMELRGRLAEAEKYAASLRDQLNSLL